MDSIDNEKINQIRNRWSKSPVISDWLNLSVEKRENVIRELEENSRQIADLNKELSQNLMTAIDVLEYLPNNNYFENLHQASEDINFLLEQVSQSKT